MTETVCWGGTYSRERSHWGKYALDEKELLCLHLTEETPPPRAGVHLAFVGRAEARDAAVQKHQGREGGGVRSRTRLAAGPGRPAGQAEVLPLKRSSQHLGLLLDDVCKVHKPRTNFVMLQLRLLKTIRTTQVPNKHLPKR